MCAVQTTYCFCFIDSCTTEIYTYCRTLSLHDSLPIFVAQCLPVAAGVSGHDRPVAAAAREDRGFAELLVGAAIPHAQQAADSLARIEKIDGDRKSTRLNSSH